MQPEQGISVAQRVQILRDLPASLTTDDIQSFYTYLREPAAAVGQNRDQENWLRNEILDKLAAAPVLPRGMDGLLIALYQDHTQDVVMRDYAIQHMMPVYGRQTDAEQKLALQQTLWGALEETDSSIAGTALLALRDLAQNHTEIDRDKVGEAALKLAADVRCGELSRITALQICARLSVLRAAPLALELARSEGNVPLRISAIAALGHLGGLEVRSFLQQIATGTEYRLKPAAESALKQLNQRLGT